MKKTGLLLLFIVIATNAWSQSSKVNVKPKNVWVEKVDFDKNATPAPGQESSYYYLLVDDQENFTLQESYSHYVYKILTTEGVQQMSDLSFDFDPSYEKFTLHTISIHRDGEVINQIPKEIRTIQREESMDRFLYDGTLTAVVNLTDVRVGDIVEYAFTRKGYNPIYGDYINRKIYFNNTFSFEKSYQKVIVPATNTFLFKYVNTTGEPQVKKDGDKVSYSWSFSRVPALISDNYEPNWYNPYEYVFISNFKNWSEVIAWASKNFYVSESDKQIVLKEISSKFKESTSEEYALQAIRFVQDEIRYLGFESGLNSHKPHPPGKVYNQRFGDCKDKSLLLVTLLRAKDIEAYPVLINTTYRDKISEQLPSANAFDHCVVQLKVDDKIIYVDPTINDQGGKLFTNYFPDYGKGLVVNTNLNDLVEIPKPLASSTTEIQTFDMSTAEAEGKLKVKTIYKGGDADGQRSYFSRNNLASTQKSYLTYYGNLYPDIEKFGSIKVLDNRDSNIFIVEESYKIPKIWKTSGAEDKSNYCDFYPQSLESYFSVSKSSQRTAPYSLYYPLNHFHEIHVNIPEDWSINPEQTTIENDYYQYERKVNYDYRHLSILTHYITKAPFIPKEAFSKFVEDHEKMMNNLSYRVAINQTSNKAKSARWLGYLLSIIILGAGVWLVLFLYRKYDPQPYYPAAWGEPIGGWLILVCIGITLSPIRLLYSFYENPSIVNGEAWLLMLYAKNYLSFIYVLLVNIYNIASLLFTILIIVLFYQRRSSIPRLISLLYAASFMGIMIDSYVALQIDPNTVVDTKEILRSVVAAAIWIPYFNKSNRVKRTFVNTYQNDNDQENLNLEPVVSNT